MKSRRSFISQSIAVTLGFTGLSHYLTNTAEAKPIRLKPAAKDWLELPEGFQSKIISRRGEVMTDGFLVPGRADGMAAFMERDRVILIRNHEVSPGDVNDGAFGKGLSLYKNLSREYFYDYGYGKTPSLGGTTTLIYNERTQAVESQFISLAGTNRNCAGGPTPWNSWITCEEDIAVKSTLSEIDHGYNFEIPASARKPVLPVPFKAMGRFNHEAVCVDPHSGIVYQTEDRGDGLIYRFIPTRPGHLHSGGVLQALAIRGQKSFDTRNWEIATMQPGKAYDVEWITMTQTDSPEDDLRYRGFDKGCAVFARGEGMWFGNYEVYFACTNGGKRKTGQVFRYVPSPEEGTAAELQKPGQLILFAEPNNTDLLKFCDNLTVSPWGDVILVEDTNGSHIRGITPEGKIYNIGRNTGSGSELAGVCFSPSGKTMFVNIQEQGLTFAITGPWENLKS